MKAPGALEGLYPLIPPPAPDPGMPWGALAIAVCLAALGLVLWRLPVLRHRRRLRHLARRATSPHEKPRVLLGELEALICGQLATPRLSPTQPPAGTAPGIWQDWLATLHVGRFGRQTPDAATVGQLIGTARRGWTSAHG